jgi:Tol biopolymer transport system component
VLALAAVVAALVPATCSPAPAFNPGPLGAVAYVENESLHVLDVSSRRNRVVAHLWIPSDEGIAWSGNGRWLTVGTDLVPAAGGPVCRPFADGSGLYGGAPGLTWSPKGDLLTATTARGVYLYRPGGTRRKILPAGWSADGFSPSGSRIAAQSPARTNTPSLWTVDLAGGRRTLLFRAPNLSVGQPRLALWTPDGRSVVFWTDSEDSASIAQDGLPVLVVPAGGGRATPLEPAVLGWRQFVRPCGSGVVVAGGRDRYVSAHKALHLLSPGSWTPRDLSADASRSWYDPSCSPDGRSIVATVTRMPGDEDGKVDSAQRTIWTLSANGTRRPLVAPSNRAVSAEGARFARDGRHLLYVEHATRYGAPDRLILLDLATSRRTREATIGGTFDWYGVHDWATAAAWYQR